MTPARFIVDSPKNKEQCLRRIQALPLEGGIWEISIKPWEPRRSVDANARLWALHQEAARATGHSVDEMHEFCKLKFLPHAQVKVGKELLEVPGRSAKLTVKEFRDFMDRVESFYISELGVVLGEL